MLELKKVIAVLLLTFFIAGIVTACGRDIDMKKFIDKMQKENEVSTEKKQEIRKSIFPNLNE